MMLNIAETFELLFDKNNKAAYKALFLRFTRRISAFMATVCSLWFIKIFSRH